MRILRCSLPIADTSWRLAASACTARGPNYWRTPTCARATLDIREEEAMSFDRRRFMQVGAAAAAGTLVPLLSRAQGSGPIKIGAFGPMSGNAAAQGQSLRQGVEMAAKAKNAAGGLLGRQIEVIIRSEEHTSELQSRFDLVCRLLLEKKKDTKYEI